MLREKPFDIYGGRGGEAEELAKTKVCFRYYVKKNLFLTNNTKKIVLNMVIFENKFASPECWKKRFASQVIFCPLHKYQMAAPLA